MTLSFSTAMWSSTCSTRVRTACGEQADQHLASYPVRDNAHLYRETDLLLIFDLLGAQLANADHLGKDWVGPRAEEACRLFPLRLGCWQGS